MYGTCSLPARSLRLWNHKSQSGNLFFDTIYLINNNYFRILCSWPKLWPSTGRKNTLYASISSVMYSLHVFFWQMLSHLVFNSVCLVSSILLSFFWRKCMYTDRGEYCFLNLFLLFPFSECLVVRWTQSQHLILTGWLICFDICLFPWKFLGVGRYALVRSLSEKFWLVPSELMRI